MNSLVYIVLYPLYLLYLLIVSIRNFAYDKNLFRTTKLNCKVISVGNVSTGGTGKTPIVIELARTLKENHKVAILSRGYGRSSKGAQLVTDGKTKIVEWKMVGDEPALMAQNLSGIPIVVDENRLRGGQYLVDSFKPDVIILDDAFQHRKIYRDIDIVLIDVNKKTKFQFLRESLSSLKRADLILLTKVSSRSNLLYWENKLSMLAIPSFESEIHFTDSLIDLGGGKFPICQFQKKPTLIFSGIGNPNFFNYSLKQLGFNILDSINYKDHHKYTDSDLNFIRSKFRKTNAEIILTTEKDIIKTQQSELPIYAVPITLNIAPAAREKINEIFR